MTDRLGDTLPPLPTDDYETRSSQALFESLKKETDIVVFHAPGLSLDIRESPIKYITSYMGQSQQSMDFDVLKNIDPQNLTDTDKQLIKALHESRVILFDISMPIKPDYAGNLQVIVDSGKPPDDNKLRTHAAVGVSRLKKLLEVLRTTKEESMEKIYTERRIIVTGINLDDTQIKRALDLNALPIKDIESLTIMGQNPLPGITNLDFYQRLTSHFADTIITNPTKNTH